MIEAVNTKLAEVAGADTPAGHLASGRTPTQNCEHFYNYLTPKDWAMIRSSSSVSTKLHFLASKSVALGLIHPTERTAAVIVSVALSEQQDLF